MEIVGGMKFDTPFEQGCIAIQSPDEHGNFAAYDSDGVVCTFCVQMVIGHPKFVKPTTKWMGKAE